MCREVYTHAKFLQWGASWCNETAEVFYTYILIFTFCHFGYVKSSAWNVTKELENGQSWINRQPRTWPSPASVFSLVVAVLLPAGGGIIKIHIPHFYRCATGRLKPHGVFESVINDIKRSSVLNKLFEGYGVLASSLWILKCSIDGKWF